MTPTASVDIDPDGIFGWGSAPWTGGVLSYADDIGLPRFLEGCQDLAAKYGKRFEPPRLLRDMVAKGRTFYDPFAKAMAAE